MSIYKSDENELIIGDEDAIGFGMSQFEYGLGSVSLNERSIATLVSRPDDKNVAPFKR